MEDGFGEKSLAYDLRIFYALVLGQRMRSADMFASKKSYPNQFEELKAMFPYIYARVDKDRKETKKTYEELIEKVNQAIIKNKEVYLMKKADDKGNYEVNAALDELTHFIYRLMHTTNILGSTSNVKGLG